MSLRDRLERDKPEPNSELKKTENKSNPFEQIKNRVQGKIIEQLTVDYNKIDDNHDELVKDIEKIAEELLQEEDNKLTIRDKDRIVSEILDEILGFGPITPLLRDQPALLPRTAQT